MPRASFFDARAETYAAARPPYPDALWQKLAELGLLRAGLRAVDLGAGTGQATRPLLAAGLDVTAVEPGARLPAILTADCPGAHVVVARAEDVDAEPGSADLVLAATSIHWMDLAAVLPRVHRMLTPGGRFVVLRTVFGDPGVSTPFRDEVDRIVLRRGDGGRGRQPLEDVDETRRQLTSTGHFAASPAWSCGWTVELDVEQVRALFGTFSDWSAREVDEVAAAARHLGGRVVEHYRSWLVVLTPRPAEAA